MKEEFHCWIAGGVDKYGKVIAHKYCHELEEGEPEHTAEEKANRVTFRYDITNQEFVYSFMSCRTPSEEEWLKIQDWLVKNNYKYE